ncbi:YesL family protein [Thermoanaerobacterium thermosaccharolyticum]|uniref:YesL family protein n=1 Tax=Thermoanaerobacterium thermosaccharolyticum TaxID=1517 RepID=UPI002FDB6FDC
MFGNFFNRMYYGDPHRPDLKADDIPKKGISLFFDILKNNFWQLISLNLLLIISCIPIVTIGPALAGFNNVLRNHTLNRNVWLWNDFKDGFIKNFKQSFVITLINGIAAIILINNYKIYSSYSTGFIKIAGTYITIFIGFILVLMNVYIYPLMATYDLKIKHIYKNALIFSIIKLPQTIGMVLLSLILIAICILFAFIPLLLIGLSLVGLAINVYDRGVFEKYIDSRVNEQNKETDDKADK